MLTPLLVLEQDPELQVVILQNLRMVVHLPQEIHVENNLMMALERISDVIYATVILDPDLPDSEGRASCDAILAKSPDIPIVVVSDNDQLGMDCVLAGAQDYISKQSLATSRLIKAIELAQLRQLGHPWNTVMKLLSDLRNVTQQNAAILAEIRETQKEEHLPLIH